MVIIDQESYHCQQRKICIYYLDAGHPLDRALLLPALNLHYNHDGDDEDDDDDHNEEDVDSNDINDDDAPG